MIRNLNFPFICLLLFAGVIETCGQATTSEFGVLIEGNTGMFRPSNFDFRSSNPEGQALLGSVGRDGDDEYGLLTGEAGAGLTFIFNNGILLKTEFHKAKSLYTNTNRLDELEVEGTWRGNGHSIGIGYSELDQEGTPFLFGASLSFGKYRSSWDFYNNDWNDEVNFGDVNIPYEESRSFSSDNFYLDLNLTGGRILFFGKRSEGFCFNSMLSMGYRQSLNRSPWKVEATGETVSEINGTLMMGLYLKLSLGIGFFSLNE